MSGSRSRNESIPPDGIDAAFRLAFRQKAPGERNGEENGTTSAADRDDPHSAKIVAEMERKTGR